jgi:hypothetical protein
MTPRGALWSATAASCRLLGLCAEYPPSPVGLSALPCGLLRAPGAGSPKVRVFWLASPEYRDGMSPPNKRRHERRFMRRKLWVVGVARLWYAGTMPAPGPPSRPGHLSLPRTLRLPGSATPAPPRVARLPARPTPCRSARSWACGTLPLGTSSVLSSKQILTTSGAQATP